MNVRPHPSDAFAQPRDPAASLRLPFGAYEYRVEPNTWIAAAWVQSGWAIVGPATSGGWLLKFTHWERIV